MAILHTFMAVVQYTHINRQKNNMLATIFKKDSNNSVGISVFLNSDSCPPRNSQYITPSILYVNRVKLIYFYLMMLILCSFILFKINAYPFG